MGPPLARAPPPQLPRGGAAASAGGNGDTGTGGAPCARHGSPTRRRLFEWESRAAGDSSVAALPAAPMQHGDNDRDYAAAPASDAAARWDTGGAAPLPSAPSLKSPVGAGRAGAWALPPDEVISLLTPGSATERPREGPGGRGGAVNGGSAAEAPGIVEPAPRAGGLNPEPYTSLLSPAEDARVESPAWAQRRQSDGFVINLDTPSTEGRDGVAGTGGGAEGGAAGDDRRGAAGGTEVGSRAAAGTDVGLRAAPGLAVGTPVAQAAPQRCAVTPQTWGSCIDLTQGSV